MVTRNAGASSHGCATTVRDVWATIRPRAVTRASAVNPRRLGAVLTIGVRPGDHQHLVIWDRLRHVDARELRRVAWSKHKAVPSGKGRDPLSAAVSNPERKSGDRRLTRVADAVRVGYGAGSAAATYALRTHNRPGATPLGAVFHFALLAPSLAELVAVLPPICSDRQPKRYRGYEDCDYGDYECGRQGAILCGLHLQ
jgi:hypothetical protein